MSPIERIFTPTTMIFDIKRPEPYTQMNEEGRSPYQYCQQIKVGPYHVVSCLCGSKQRPLPGPPSSGGARQKVHREPQLRYPAGLSPADFFRRVHPGVLGHTAPGHTPTSFFLVSVVEDVDIGRRVYPTKVDIPLPVWRRQGTAFLITLSVRILFCFFFYTLAIP